MFLVRYLFLTIHNFYIRDFIWWLLFSSKCLAVLFLMAFIAVYVWRSFISKLGSPSLYSIQNMTNQVIFNSNQVNIQIKVLTIIISFRIAFQLLLPFIGKSLPNHSQIRCKHLSSAFPMVDFSMSSQITCMPYQINSH